MAVAVSVHVFPDYEGLGFRVGLEEAKLVDSPSRTALFLWLGEPHGK